MVVDSWIPPGPVEERNLMAVKAAQKPAYAYGPPRKFTKVDRKVQANMIKSVATSCHGMLLDKTHKVLNTLPTSRNINSDSTESNINSSTLTNET